MSIKVLFGNTTLLKPGAYSVTEVLDSSLAAPSLGIVALVGESDSGIPFSQETGLSAVVYGPDEFSAIQAKYGSGRLVDAAKLAIQASNDSQIVGGAQQLIIIKTNASVAAQANLVQGSNVYGVVKALNTGVDGNNINVQVATAANQSVITINNVDTGVSEISNPLGNTQVLTIQCTDSVATAATLTISPTTLSTTITGSTTTQPLNILLSRFTTIGQLAAYISTMPGYTASVASTQLGNQSPSRLDEVSAVDIKTAPYVVKQDAFEVQDFFSKSSQVSFVPSIQVGLPTTSAKTFLSGGALGGTSAAQIQDSFDALLATRINFMVPLFSQDAAADIAAGLTDPSSNYSIAACNAGALAHVNQASTVKGRKERQAFLSFVGSFAATQEASAVLNGARAQLLFQNVDVLSASTGAVETMQPFMLAVIAAGMKAGAAVGLPNTFKSPNIQGFSHQDFDPELNGDDALNANLCFVENSPTGSFRFVLDNSTYSQDLDAWIYNRPSVLYAADVAAYAIRINTETFVGQRNSDVSEESVKNLLVGVMDQLKSAGIIVGDKNSAGKGYKDLSVSIQGSIVYVNITLVLVEGIEFILNTIKVQRAG